MTRNELFHYGIFGMKWGIRRYQNKDGSLTPAGKRRRANLQRKIDELDKPHSEKKTKEPKKKVSDMSNEELQQIINRMRLERDYYELKNRLATINPSTSRKVGKVVKKAGGSTLKSIGRTTKKIGMTIVKEVFGTSSGNTKKKKP